MDNNVTMEAEGGMHIVRAHIIMLTGAPGSGKSYFATRFAETFNTPLVTATKVSAITGDETATKKILLINFLELLKTSKTIVLDCLAQSKPERDKLLQMAKEYNYETLLIWVQTDTVTTRQRFNKQHGLADDTDLFNRFSRSFQAPTSSEQYVVISGRHTYPTQSRIVLKQIAQFRTNHSNDLGAPSVARSRRTIPIMKSRNRQPSDIADRT